MNRQFLAGVSVVLFVLALAAVGALFPAGRADTGSSSETSVAPTADSFTPGTAALRAYLNPETGELEVGMAPVAGPGLDPETQNALRRDAEGLVEVHHPDGSVSIDLQGRFQSVSVLRINDDGRVIVCTDNGEGAGKALQGGSGSATPEVK